jgi:hypothetical protein
MANKLKLWDQKHSWEQAENEWEQRALLAKKTQPIKTLKNPPQMVGITPETKRFLKWKSLKWMVTQDHERKVLKGFLKHPIKYGAAFLRSIFKKNSYQREGDFFYYGIQTLQDFEKLLHEKNTLFVVGFSYCHKPFECPSGRFTSECIHDLDNLVCQQCFIGKAFHTLPAEKTIPLVIPTVHYIGGKIFEIVHAHPDKKVIFVITACEMTLQMFGDWGNMAGIMGIGVRLDGRICNTMRAFELSEQGIKPGLTIVREETQIKVLHLLRQWREKTQVFKV